MQSLDNFVYISINGSPPIKCYPATHEELFGKKEVHEFKCPICGRNVKGIVCYHDSMDKILNILRRD